MSSQLSSSVKSDVVANELEKLRNHYSSLKKEKKVKEEIALKKALNASASDVQIRLYQEGVDKLSALKIKEEEEASKDPYAVNVRSTSPSPICDRLYEEGMLKMKQVQERDQPSPIRSNSRSRVTASPVCDRLYKQGMEKVRERSLSRQREEEHQSTFSTVKTDVRPNLTAERLYTEGLARMRARSRSRSISNRVPRQRSKSRSNMIPTKSNKVLPPRGRSPFAQRD